MKIYQTKSYKEIFMRLRTWLIFADQVTYIAMHVAVQKSHRLHSYTVPWPYWLLQNF